MRYPKEQILNGIKGSIIVSGQALPGEPLYVEEKSIMYLMAFYHTIWQKNVDIIVNLM